MRASISWPVPLPVRFTISPPAEIGCHARPELQTVLVVDFSAIAQDASMISQLVSGPWTPSDSSMRGHRCRVEQVTSTIKYRIQTKAGDDPKRPRVRRWKFLSYLHFSKSCVSLRFLLKRCQKRNRFKTE